MNQILHCFYYSTAQPSTIREYVYQFLMCVGISYGDLVFNQFEDGFLIEHVKSITVCDTELVSRDRKVRESYTDSHVRTARVSLHNSSFIMG